MVTLRIVPERLLDPRPGGSRRMAVNLSRQLVARAPASCDVEAILPKLTPDELAAIEAEVPGLSHVSQGPLRHDKLAASWRRGLLTGVLGGGFIHALGLYAPIRDISLAYGIDQTVVTVHHTSAMRHPELHDDADVKFQTAMLRRAYRFASAIVAPTNAVADELMSLYDFGDRLRVIGGAADRAIALPASEAAGDELAASMGLPDEYVLTMASPSPRKGLAELFAAFAQPALADARLVVVGPGTLPGDPERTVASLAAAAGLGEGRIVHLGEIGDTELAVALQRASALVVPSLEAGFGLPIVEAFEFGTPVVTSDAPALREVGMDATVTVARRAGSAGGGAPVADSAGAAGVAGLGGGVPASTDDGYPQRLAEGITRVLGDTELARRLRIAGRDRAGVHRWELAADQVWALHADL